MATLFSPFTYTFPKEFLTEFKCSSGLFPHAGGAVVSVTQEDTLQNALQTLTDNKILSAPIIDQTRKPIGTFSIRYLIAYLLHCFSEADFINTSKSIQDSISGLFSNKRIREMLSELDNNKYEPTHLVNKSETLLGALLIMIRSEAPRALVVDAEDKLSRVITQSRVVSLLSTMLDSIPSAEKTLKELGLGFCHVFSVEESSSAYNAFKLMIDKNISAVPVVNKDKVLIGNISMSDIKLLGYDTRYFKLLGGTVNDYLKQVHSPQFKRNRIQSELLKSLQENVQATPVVSVHPEDSLGDAMHLLHIFKVHRVYITDSKNCLVGVLALHDILQHIVHANVPGAD